MPTRIDYCQFLLSSQANFTITYYAEHVSHFTHDAMNRYLKKEKMTARMVWEHVKGEIVHSPRGCVVFDDSILDKSHSHHIELVKRQYSGNAHGLIKGISMVNCFYVNPDSGQYWIIDYRIYDPDRDGQWRCAQVPQRSSAELGCVQPLRGQDRQAAGVPQRTQGQIIPGRGFRKPHGMGHNQ